MPSQNYAFVNGKPGFKVFGWQDGPNDAWHYKESANWLDSDMRKVTGANVLWRDTCLNPLVDCDIINNVIVRTMAPRVILEIDTCIKNIDTYWG